MSVRLGVSPGSEGLGRGVWWAPGFRHAESAGDTRMSCVMQLCYRGMLKDQQKFRGILCLFKKVPVKERRSDSDSGLQNFCLPVSTGLLLPTYSLDSSPRLRWAGLFQTHGFSRQRGTPHTMCLVCIRRLPRERSSVGETTLPLSSALQCRSVF